ncbi:hypothetical protein J7T55_005637 [Diaporthe amygdali]|uniref:uncharacterized protein n=1 Tax=Phomopsis amygdali TaxID=1214568 RepID=UPI0022FEBD1F|nr:uncharacterized protein J7T55_005637 [Diaporthe amygdali]KAJ0124299.1 hypothetical protein J7T55_005637 [Diaporthe amygdali]
MSLPVPGLKPFEQQILDHRDFPPTINPDFRDGTDTYVGTACQHSPLFDDDTPPQPESIDPFIRRQDVQDCRDLWIPDGLRPLPRNHSIYGYWTVRGFRHIAQHAVKILQYKTFMPLN